MIFLLSASSHWASNTHVGCPTPSFDLSQKDGHPNPLTGFYPKLKSFWSCSHMNCCQHYMLHINLDILDIHFIKFNLNLKEFQESIKYLKSYQVNKI